MFDHAKVNQFRSQRQGGVGRSFLVTNTVRAIPGELKILTVDEILRRLAKGEQYGLLAFLVLVSFCVYMRYSTGQMNSHHIA